MRRNGSASIAPNIRNRCDAIGCGFVIEKMFGRKRKPAGRWNWLSFTGAFIGQNAVRCALIRARLRLTTIWVTPRSIGST